MKLLRLVPDNTHLGFMRFRRLSFPFSGLLSVVAIGLLVTMGLNFGIDFRGGTLIEMRTLDGPADVGGIREVIGTLNVGDAQIQRFGAPDEVLVRVEAQPGGDLAQQAVVEKIKAAFGDKVEYRRVEVVGPVVSGELVEAGTLAVLVSILAVLIYIWFRFEWQFAIGAIIATVHDVVLTMGMFAIVQLEFNLSSIAAILTIVGYSLNDTVVVYDRIRETVRRYKKRPLPELLDLAINETLSRTVMTSLTTLLALIALYFLGGEVIRSFTFAMIWGVLVGTYSSIFIAAPVLIFLNLRPGPTGTGAAATATGTTDGGD